MPGDLHEVWAHDKVAYLPDYCVISDANEPCPEPCPGSE